MNDKTDDLLADIKKANKHKLIPLSKSNATKWQRKTLLGFNEISIIAKKHKQFKLILKLIIKKS